MPIYKRSWFVLLSCLIFPPAGLVLTWLAPGSAWKKSIASLFIAAIGVGHLFFFYGLRYEIYGEGAPSKLTFNTPAAHDALVEQSREQMKTVAPPVIAAPAGPDLTAYWSDFRGPFRAGVYDQQPILTAWPAAGLQQLWKQPVGAGYAAFVTALGLAYTIEQRRGNEVVAVYDIRTGIERWNHSWPARFEESMGGPGPRATPVFDEGRIYALGAEGELQSLDAATGKQIWRTNILTDAGAKNIQWGMSASPLVAGGKVIVNPGGASDRSIIAYDKQTGKQVWSTLSDTASYTAPMFVTLAGRQQVLAVTTSRVVGLSLEDGKLLWDFPWATDYDVNSAQPIVVSPNRFFISAGYGHGAAVVELTLDGTVIQPKQVWTNNRMKNRFNSSVLHQGFVYGLDEGILACIDVETGALKWKGGRYGYGQLLLASGHLVVLTEEGELVLVKATPEKLEEVTRFQAIEGKTWNHPAITNGILLIRNANEMAAFRIGKTQ